MLNMLIEMSKNTELIVCTACRTEPFPSRNDKNERKPHAHRSWTPETKMRHQTQVYNRKSNAMRSAFEINSKWHGSVRKTTKNKVDAVCKLDSNSQLAMEKGECYRFSNSLPARGRNSE